MTTLVTPAVTADDARGAGETPRRRSAAWLGLAPFVGYVLMFLAIPTVLAVGTGFFTEKGAVTLANFSALANPVVLQSFWNSIWISAVTALIGAVAGAIICYALMGTRPDGVLRTVVDAASSVLAQFGGVMLAFAFIATIGVTGFLTKWFVQLGWAPNPFQNFGNNGPLLYQASGLIAVYPYFQIPLMVITFLPALEGLKTTWAEANATLGGTRATYWLRVGIPIVAPAFLGSTILLFANAFSSYATAAALVVQGNIVLPLAIKQTLTSETVVGVQNLAGVLALAMLAVMVVLMTLYALLQRRASRWQTGGAR